MQLPFTAEQFFAVFRTYNQAVWPAQLRLNALGALALGLALLPAAWAGATISLVLGLLWAWTGLAYHLAFFTAINPLAYGFAALALAGSALLLWHGVVRRRLRFRWSRTPRAVTGVALAAFALVGYPLWTSWTGHPYPELPTFGLPCPTTLFTLGLLGLAERPHPRGPLVVPVLWCAVGAQAALLLGASADLMLAPAGAFGVALGLRAGAERERGRS